MYGIDLTTRQPKNLVLSGDRLLVEPSGNVDSVGGALPADFDNLAMTCGYTGENLTTIVKTKGANTWTQTLTYSGAKVTAVSQWVKA